MNSEQYGILSCNTNDLENDHSQTHYKTTTPTILHYAHDLATVVWEDVKRNIKWTAHYFLDNTSCYHVKKGQVSLLSDHMRCLTDLQKYEMEDWASIHGKCVRQVSVRQQITKFKAGTCPLEMYQRKLPDQGDYAYA